MGRWRNLSGLSTDSMGKDLDWILRLKTKYKRIIKPQTVGHTKNDKMVDRWRSHIFKVYILIIAFTNHEIMQNLKMKYYNPNESSSSSWGHYLFTFLDPFSWPFHPLILPFNASINPSFPTGLFQLYTKCMYLDNMIIRLCCINFHKITSQNRNV